MKKLIVSFILLSQFLSTLSWSNEFSTEHTIRQLRSNRQIDLSLYPTIHTYRAACGIEDSVPTHQLPSITLMCETIMDSEFCSGVESQDRLNCRQASQQPQFNLWEFLSGCASGIMQSISELLSFIWEIMKWVWNNATSSSARAQTSEAATRYSRAIRSYLHTEYERAYARTSFPFRQAKAIRAMGESISRMIIGLVSDLVTQQYRQFGCLNYRAKSRLMCRLIGDIFIPPAAMIALIKRGPAAIRQFPNLARAFRRLEDQSNRLVPQTNRRTRESEGLGEESISETRVVGTESEIPIVAESQVNLTLRSSDSVSNRERLSGNADDPPSRTSDSSSDTRTETENVNSRHPSNENSFRAQHSDIDQMLKDHPLEQDWDSALSVMMADEAFEISDEALDLMKRQIAATRAPGATLAQQNVWRERLRTLNVCRLRP